MADKAKDDMIDNFVKITSVDRDRAMFYLESSAWNLELAIGSFYEGDPDDDGNLGDKDVYFSTAESPSFMEPDVPATAGHVSGSRKGKSGESSNSRFATIGSMLAADSASSEEEGQAFYAGGSERSGQQVLGPKKKKTNVVADLFKSAIEHGAEEVVDSTDPQGTSGSSAFKGSGYQLGNSVNQPLQRVFSGPVSNQRRKKVECVLKLWKGGFSVDDGPFRDYKDPLNSDFLQSVTLGEIPQELIQNCKGGEVDLNMEDHRMEDYVKAKVPVKAFMGEGHTLGSPVPTVVGTSASSKMSSSSSSRDGLPNQNGQSEVNVNNSKPVTTIQIRLSDGTRLVTKFNNIHTISDIRKYITTSCPQYQSTHFILQTTFPNRDLTDENETLEHAQLLNAVVVQRIK